MSELTEYQYTDCSTIMTVAAHLITGKHGGTRSAVIFERVGGGGVEWVAEGSGSMFLKVNDTVACSYSFIY